jgi:hypothetical protein
VRLATLLVLVLAAPVAHAEPSVRSFDSAEAIFREVLKGKPRVVAFGEYHETKEGPKVRSAIKRFTEEMLPLLQKRAGDVVIETWIPSGKCGQKEAEVTQKVDETIQRPETTEDEVVTLINRASDAGVEPHILVLSCAEYASIQPDDEGKLDYVKLLEVITTQLKKTILGVLAGRVMAKPKDRDKLVLVYGGALHNDVFPQKELAAFSFAPDLTRITRGRYLEVDLYVPELVEDDAQVTAEPWWPVWEKLPRGKLALVKRSSSSYIIVFPRTPGATAPPAE